MIDFVFVPASPPGFTAVIFNDITFPCGIIYSGASAYCIVDPSIHFSTYNFQPEYYGVGTFFGVEQQVWPYSFFYPGGTDDDFVPSGSIAIGRLSLYSTDPPYGGFVGYYNADGYLLVRRLSGPARYRVECLIAGGFACPSGSSGGVDDNAFSLFSGEGDGSAPIDNTNTDCSGLSDAISWDAVGFSVLGSRVKAGIGGTATLVGFPPP